MTEVLGTIAMVAGGYALYKLAKKELNRFQQTVAKPAYARAASQNRPIQTLVQDPVTGKYHPIER
ncbi:hypothetical protein [Flexibacterium corallicola]|uniref:hypothetical protein n=1 Tax=Flexibacterium corallicola TaxID=3037259 RepID=UPI00286EE53D|nr:hypothetical protein [Pseudovibrio sp. M1P-2-3]